MKSIITILISLFATSTYAYYYTDIYEEACQEYLTTTNDKPDVHGDEMTCFDSQYADLVLSAKPDFTTKKTSNTYLWDIVELGVMPDDSTGHLYSYEHNLLDKNGKIVGYFQVIAAHNSEGEWGVKLKNRYDLDGQIVYSEASGL